MIWMEFQSFLPVFTILCFPYFYNSLASLIFFPLFVVLVVSIVVNIIFEFAGTK